MSEICTTCRKKVTFYLMCDREPAEKQYCKSCFSQHPCGKGEHGEGCETAVFEEEEQ